MGTSTALLDTLVLMLLHLGLTGGIATSNFSNANEALIGRLARMKLNNAEQAMLETLLATVPFAVIAVVSCLASGCSEILAEFPKSIQANLFMRPGAMNLWNIPRLATPSAALTARLRSSLTEPFARSCRQISAFRQGFECMIKHKYFANMLAFEITLICQLLKALRADKTQFYTREVFGETNDTKLDEGRLLQILNSVAGLATVTVEDIKSVMEGAAQAIADMAIVDTSLSSLLGHEAVRKKRGRAGTVKADGDVQVDPKTVATIMSNCGLLSYQSRNRQLSVEVGRPLLGTWFCNF
eukprot:2717821-Amphidinium_carterae.1